MILNSNHNYKEANFNFSQNNVVHNNNINKNANYRAPFIPPYINYNNNNNNNFINQNRIFNNNNFMMNQYMNSYNPQINGIPTYSNVNRMINPINNFNNYNQQYTAKNYQQKEKLEIECICFNNNYSSKKELKHCILCKKYQHKACIHQAQYITPYICFNCQFIYNHFYLKPRKTILPAHEFIYKKEWEDDTSLLKEGTKNFEFGLDIKDIYDKFNINSKNYNEDNSYYLAFLCLTNNGKPFHLGFPDNINISINDKKFYNTESKGFKRPLLLALENNKFYIPKRRHLITSDKYEIPNAENYFSDKNKIQKVTISFANNLENYRGSEFEFVDVRHYLFYIGIFQEIKIPQMSLLRECKNLEEYNKIFKNFYEEKVIKLNWNQVANFVTMENEQLNMNLISEISNQKIIRPVRGLFCQHSEVMDYGECCGYITSNNQVYKCFKCNKPLNIMYIDDRSQKIFDRYIKENYSQIYYTNDFKFIRGEKIEENNGKEKEDKNNNKIIENEEDESLSESFFKFHEKKINNIEYNEDKNETIQGNVLNEIIEINSDTESMIIEPNNNNISPAPVLNYPNVENENENGNEKEYSNENNDIIINSNLNKNSNSKDNVIIVNNLDKSNDEIQEDDNNENNNMNNNNNVEKNKINNEEIITLIEDDDDIEKEKDNSSNVYDIGNVIPDIEKDKENMMDNNISNQQINKSINNINDDKTNEKDENENSLNNNFQSINLQKNKQSIFDINMSKKSDSIGEGRTHEYLEKKRIKIMNKKNRKKENEKEKENMEKEIYSPKKRILLRRIERSPSLKSKNKNNIKDKKNKKEKEKKNKKRNKTKETKINSLNNINNIINKSNSEESLSSVQNNNNYINIQNINEISNSEEKSISKSENDDANDNRNTNKMLKNKSEIKKRRRNSDIASSSSNSNNNQSNIGFSEYNTKESNKNKNKKRRKKKLMINDEEEKEKISNDLSNIYKNKDEGKENSKNNINMNINFNKNEFIPLSERFEETQINNNIENSSNEGNEDDEYETIMIDRKDLIEIRPYNEYQEKHKKLNDEEGEEFLNDFDIFENGLLNNNQMEFLNYDYYNIQRRLREYCSIRYQDDEIFNGNKTFFNNLNK